MKFLIRFCTLMLTEGFAGYVGERNGPIGVTERVEGRLLVAVGHIRDGSKPLDFFERILAEYR